MSFIPPHQKQLGRPTGSTACGPVSISVGIHAITRGDIKPGIQDIRARMGKADGPTNVWDAERAVTSYKHGGKPLTYRKVFDIEKVKTAVKNGRPVQIAVDYGMWNKRMQTTGSPTFIGGHSLLVYGQKRWKDGTVVWRVYDSLEDARRPGIPKGWKWRPRWKVVDAMESLVGPETKGRCYAGIFGGGKHG